MKIQKNERKENTVFLEVEEDYAVFEVAVDKSLAQAGREIKIPGFRAGKAPKEMVERSVNREVLNSQAAQDLISGLYPKILDESKIEPVDYPKVEIIQQKKNEPFVFKLSVEVYPDVKLGKYKGIKVEKHLTKVTDEDVLKVLENLRQRFSETDPEGKKDLLPLDDEFAKKVGQHKTLAELKQEILTALQKDKTSRAEAAVKDKLVAAASAEAKFDLPPAMTDREVNVMLDELRNSLSQSGLTLEDYLKGIKKEEKAMREELRKSAEIRVKGKIVLRAVAESEQLKVSEDEMEEELKSLATASGRKIEELKSSLEEGSKKYIEEYMLRRKALDFLVEKAKISEVDRPLEKEAVEEEKK